jgi:hypothetical protein
MDPWNVRMYEGVSKSFRTGRLEREQQMVQLSATRCSFIAILWVSLVSFAAITLCVASHLVFIIVIDSVRKLRVFVCVAKAFPEFNLFFISSWMQFWFVSVIYKYFNFAILSKDF